MEALTNPIWLTVGTHRRAMSPKMRLSSPGRPGANLAHHDGLARYPSCGQLGSAEPSCPQREAKTGRRAAWNDARHLSF